MLRSISRDVVPHNLSHFYSCRSHTRSTTSALYSISFARHYSPFVPTQTPKPSDDAPPIVSPTRKSKLELKPGPLKPKSLAHVSPLKTNAPVHKQEGSQTHPTLSLSAAKQEALKDISDAEKHGYLTPPSPDANWFRATLHKAIQLAKFYFRGVKLIWSRRKDIAAIRARIKAGGPPMTRAEFRMIHTQKDDINKVIPFIIIALIVEEVIPIIAIYAPFMLPSTCILPSQQQRIEAKRAEKALAASINFKAVFSSLKAQSSSEQVSLDALKQVGGAPTAICSVLGLSTLGFDALRIRRVRKHLQFLAKDDALLLQDAAQLLESDRINTLAERGLLVKTGSKEKALQSWLNAVKDKTPEEALAARLFLIVSNQ